MLTSAFGNCKIEVYEDAPIMHKMLIEQNTFFKNCYTFNYVTLNFKLIACLLEKKRIEKNTHSANH